MISIIIPAYNEAERIQRVVQETLPFGHEVIVVDDGSQDNTFDLAQGAGARVVRQENSGYIAAIKRGFQEAKGDILVTMDADGEHHPLDIQRLVWPIECGQADLVLGKRYHVARLSERIISTLTAWKTGVYDTGTGMRAMRRDLALQLTLPGRCICGTSVLEAHHIGARILETPILLRNVNKPRKIAWGHALQSFYVLWWLLR
jgi:glycosyltransferase involved in cell wall biosynthesis